MRWQNKKLCFGRGTKTKARRLPGFCFSRTGAKEGAQFCTNRRKLKKVLFFVQKCGYYAFLIKEVAAGSCALGENGCMSGTALCRQGGYDRIGASSVFVVFLSQFRVCGSGCRPHV
jgi:hypothetical protein